MYNFFKNSLNSARKFTVVDFGIFKTYLVAVGILLGAYFSPFFLKYICAVWTVAIIGLVFILIQLVRYSCNCKKKD